jgi:hypothetical protein
MVCARLWQLSEICRDGVARVRPAGHSIYSRGCACDTLAKSEQVIMPYIISGTNLVGALSLKRDSAAAALKKARELAADGFRDVEITDPEGRVHAHAEFAKLNASVKSG